MKNKRKYNVNGTKVKRKLELIIPWLTLTAASFLALLTIVFLIFMGISSFTSNYDDYKKHEVVETVSENLYVLSIEKNSSLLKEFDVKVIDESKQKSKYREIPGNMLIYEYNNYKTFSTKHKDGSFKFNRKEFKRNQVDYVYIPEKETPKIVRKKFKYKNKTEELKMKLRDETPYIYTIYVPENKVYNFTEDNF